MTAQQRRYKEQLVQASDEQAKVYQLSQDFVTMLKERKAGELQHLLERASQSHIAEFKSLARACSMITLPFMPPVSSPGVKDKSKDRSIVSSCSNANPMDGLALVCYAIGSLRGLLELCTEDEADPDSLGQYK